MMISDHLNLMGSNPLVGPAQEGETRFPDMTDAYDPGLRRIMRTTAERLKEYPDIPTARELDLAPMEDVMGWSGLWGPPGLPPEVVNKWVEALKKIAQDPDWLRGNASFGGIPAIRSQQDTEKFAREQFELYTRLGAQLGLKK